MSGLLWRKEKVPVVNWAGITPFRFPGVGDPPRGSILAVYWSDLWGIQLNVRNLVSDVLD